MPGWVLEEAIVAEAGKIHQSWNKVLLRSRITWEQAVINIEIRDGGCIVFVGNLVV